MSIWDTVSKTWEAILVGDDIGTLNELYTNRGALQDACNAYAAAPTEANMQAVDAAARAFRQSIIDAAVPIPFVGAPSGLLDAQSNAIDRWRELDDAVDKAFNRPGPKFDRWVQDSCSNLGDSPEWADQFRAAGNVGPFPTSPIILDLDGDGVETLSKGSGTYFDHNADGFAESTGWVAPDDGLLVFDQNGNGLIDSGKELFGNETILANGQKAANGFDALIELDANVDGVIDNQDTIWSSLKMWRDLNGDGLSSSNELFSLPDVGVASISVGYTDSWFVDVVCG